MDHKTKPRLIKKNLKWENLNILFSVSALRTHSPLLINVEIAAINNANRNFAVGNDCIFPSNIQFNQS